MRYTRLTEIAVIDFHTQLNKVVAAKPRHHHDGMQTVHQCLGVNTDLTLASLCNLPAALLFAFKLVNDSDEFDTGPLEKISA
jgi:hypothetical protein